MVSARSRPVRPMPIVRPCRPRDSAAVADLLRRNPSDEFPLLGLNPDQVEGIFRRLQQWNIRLVLGIAAALRRPLVQIWVIADGDRILGVAMVSFSPDVAQVGGLTIDASARRRGYAQELMNACARSARRFHRSFLVLDVLATNAPAFHLYQKLGYRTIRDVRWMARDLTQPPLGPPPAPLTGLRPFRPADGPVLADLANAAMPPSVRPIVRLRPQDFRTAGLSRRAGRVEAASWVLEREHRIVGYAKAFVSPAVEAAQIGPLVAARTLTAEECEGLVRTTLLWCSERQAPRAVLALPDHMDGLRPTLEQLGFTESFRLHTMALDGKAP